MSPVKQAKAHCGYEERPVHQTCGNCGAFSSELALTARMVGKVHWLTKEPYTVEKNGVEKNLRCSDHGFAVKKTANCKLWRAKPEKPQ